ncbi:unnamed protein product, partial [Rotaria sp. Silwood2]
MISVIQEFNVRIKTFRIQLTINKTRLQPAKTEHQGPRRSGFPIVTRLPIMISVIQEFNVRIKTFRIHLTINKTRLQPAKTEHQGPRRSG